MNRIQQFLLVILAGSLLAAGCAPAAVPTQAPTGQTAQPGGGGAEPVRYLQSAKPRIENPQVPAGDLEALAEGNRAFALDLYRQLSRQDGDLFYSPYSISLALAMTFAGARGETAAQMARALRFDLPQSGLHPAFNALSQALASRAQPAREGEEGGLELNIANSLWGQAGFAFQTEFLDSLAENYGAGLREVDFAQSEQARQFINDWVAEETHEKIKDLIPEGALNELTRLVLANAIYFKAAWQSPFDEALTGKGEFTLLDGGMIEVDTMRQSGAFGHVSGEGYQAVSLPYSGGSAEMLILLPDQGRFVELERALDGNRLNEILAGIESRPVDLAMPKFKVESSFSLAEVLAAMGMPDAFDPAKADFSGMTGKPDLYISSVVHKAYVDVNEAGTEAAAATGVIMTLKAMPLEPVQVRVDRPFVFLILDRDTGTVLFLGRVLDPR